MTPTDTIIALEKALEAGPTLGEWMRNAQLNGPFWHISSDHTIDGEPCKSGRQAVASVHGESKRGTKAYAAMFEANANWIAAANPLAIRTLLDAHASALQALQSIAAIDPEVDSDEGFNEWGEAHCFRIAQKRALAALDDNTKGAAE